MTKSRAWVAIIVTWVATLIQAFASISWAKDTNQRPTCLKMMVHTRDIEKTIKGVGVYFILIQRFVLTFLVLAPIYFKISRTAWRLIQTDPHFSHFPPEAQTKQKKKEAERKLTITIGVTFGLYIFCNIPVIVYFPVVLKMYTVPYPFAILLGWRLLRLVFWLQFFLNPIVYAFKDRMLRGAYRKMFCRNSVGILPYHDIYGLAPVGASAANATTKVIAATSATAGTTASKTIPATTVTHC